MLLDTGFQTTSLCPEFVRALNLQSALKDEVDTKGIAGIKVKGRPFGLPEISVLGVTERTVAAITLDPSPVGVDGLLGQSFLRRFICAIDPGRQSAVSLSRRRL